MATGSQKAVNYSVADYSGEEAVAWGNSVLNVIFRKLCFHIAREQLSSQGWNCCQSIAHENSLTSDDVITNWLFPQEWLYYAIKCIFQKLQSPGDNLEQAFVYSNGYCWTDVDVIWYSKSSQKSICPM